MRREAATFVAALALAGAAGAQTPEQVRALLDRGDAAGAYELARRAPERLGEPEFDFAFGVAAVHAGRPAEGVLALERFLLLDPDHEPARVELARGYFLLGDDLRAREEFELALRRRPPPHVARVIEEHLAALAARAAARRPSLAGWIEAGAGYDSNPRAGVQNALITLPVLGEVTVPEAGVRDGDRMRQYGAGIRATMPLARPLTFFAAGQADAVSYSGDFDQAIFAGSMGVIGQARGGTWRAGASRGYQRLDRNPYRHTSGLFADFSRPLDGRNVLSVGAQGGKLAYSGANAVRDADFGMALIGWRHALSAAWRPLLEASLNAGRERNGSGRHDLSRDLLGGRIAVVAHPAAAWTLTASLTAQRSRYREPDLLLETTRRDDYWIAELVVAWHLTRELALRLELAEARNDSNLALHEYRRRTALVRGRYDFR